MSTLQQTKDFHEIETRLTANAVLKNSFAIAEAAIIELREAAANTQENPTHPLGLIDTGKPRTALFLALLDMRKADPHSEDSDNIAIITRDVRIETARIEYREPACW